MIIHTPLSITAIGITTTATMIFIGLGYLPRPSRAGALWLAAFTAAMVATYLWTASEILETLQLRGIANGLALGSMALIWSGLRSLRGVSPKYSITLAALVLLPLSLLLASYTDFHGISFRCATVVASIFAALAIIELLRLGTVVRDEVLPLVASAALFIVSAVISVVDGFMVASGATNNSDSLLFIRGVNFIGINVLVVCALTTLLLLTTQATSLRTTPTTTHSMFESVARNRLSRAETSGDPWWSFVDIRLDDPDDIRVASSTAMFNEVSEHFIREVYATLPADSDLEQMSPTRVVALVPRAQGSMREILSNVLQKVADTSSHQKLPIKISASIGWAQAPNSHYDFDSLLDLAATAARTAHGLGGDRWERVHAEE